MGESKDSIQTVHLRFKDLVDKGQRAGRSLDESLVYVEHGLMVLHFVQEKNQQALPRLRW